MTKINKSDVFDLLRSILISVLISVMGVVILALIAKFADLSDGVITGVNIFIRVAAVLIGMLIGIRAGRYFIAKGLIAGGVHPSPAAAANLFYVAFPPGRWHTAAMSIFTTSTPVIGTPENGEWPLVHPLACLPEPALESPTQGSIPDDAACMALWDKYGMLDNIRAHSRMVAHIATELAQRARAAGFPVNVAAVRASAMLHDIAKTYSVLHGGSHAQLGASWVVAETRNHALAQGVLLHVHWPWAVPEQEPERLFSIPFFVIYADKRVKHDQCVPLRQRYEDLLVRYGHTEKARKGIRLSWQQGECIERAFEAHLGYAIHEDSFDSGRLVQRA